MPHQHPQLKVFACPRASHTTQRLNLTPRYHRIKMSTSVLTRNFWHACFPFTDYPNCLLYSNITHFKNVMTNHEASIHDITLSNILSCTQMLPSAVTLFCSILILMPSHRPNNVPTHIYTTRMGRR